MTQVLTIAEIRQWSPTCDVADAATALGISRSAAYEAIKLGTFPVRTIRVGGRIRVITASLIELLA